MPVLRRLREAAGLTQVELARQIPDKTRRKTLSGQVISGWERGEYEPELTIIQMKALCRALNLALDELPNDFGPPNQPSWRKCLGQQPSDQQQALGDEPADLDLPDPIDASTGTTYKAENPR